jgi:hypothetical protein
VYQQPAGALTYPFDRWGRYIGPPEMRKYVATQVPLSGFGADDLSQDPLVLFGGGGLVLGALLGAAAGYAYWGKKGAVKGAIGGAVAGTVTGTVVLFSQIAKGLQA